jgi:hypothetical protein
MLLKPVVAFGPVIVKDKVVVVVDWFDVIVALDICEVVMFPVIASSTIEPLSVFTGTVANGGGEGDGVAVGVFLGLEVGVGVGVELGACVGVGVGEFVTANELLTPEILPSATVIITAEPAVFTVTKVDPTPLTKAFIMPGLIDPAETVKDGVPI